MSIIKKIYRIVWLLMMLVGWGISGHAQNHAGVAEYLKKINQAYSGAGSFQFAIRYSVYKSATSSIAVETSTGKYYKKDQSYLWIAGEQYIMQNKQYFISADKENKSLLIGKPVGQSEAFLPVPVDSLLVLASDHKLIEKGEEKEIQLTFGFMLDNVSRMDIRFGANGLISRLVFYYNHFIEDEKNPLVSSSPRLEMVFTPMEKDPSQGDEMFSEKSFFHLKDGKIIPVGVYKDYFLIDQRF